VAGNIRRKRAGDSRTGIADGGEKLVPFPSERAGGKACLHIPEFRLDQFAYAFGKVIGCLVPAQHLDQFAQTLPVVHQVFHLAGKQPPGVVEIEQTVLERQERLILRVSPGNFLERFADGLVEEKGLLVFVHQG